MSAVPAPKNSVSLGAFTSAGSGRRAIIETEVPASNLGNPRPEKDESIAGKDNSGIDQNGVNNAEQYSYANYEPGSDQNVVNYGYYENYNSGFDQSGDGSSYGGYESYGSYGEYGQHYGNNWDGGSAAAAAAVPEVSGAVQSGFGGKGKRGRSEIPTEIVEVKQDELIKNRPREDQVKATGIAFGPSYQVLHCACDFVFWLSLGFFVLFENILLLTSKITKNRELSLYFNCCMCVMFELVLRLRKAIPNCP